MLFRSPEKFCRIAQALGVVVSGMSSETAAKMAITSISELIEVIGLDRGLTEIGLRPEDIPQLSRNAVKDACLVTNPRSASVVDIENLFRQAL